MSSIKVIVPTEQEKRNSRRASYITGGFLLLLLIGSAALLVIALDTMPPWGFVALLVVVPAVLLFALWSMFTALRRLDRVGLTITDTELVCIDVFRTRTFPLDEIRGVGINPWDDLVLYLPYGKSYEIHCVWTKERKAEGLEEINKALARRDERRAAKA